MILSVSFLSSIPLTESNRPIIFDFDTGTPILAETSNTPLNQTSQGVTAFFSSPSDNANPAFSIQSYDTTFVSLSKFSDKWLYDNQPSTESLDIVFNRELTSIKLTFATVEYHGGSGTKPSEIVLTAYKDGINTTPLGKASASGFFTSDPYPQGIISFDSKQPFNMVCIELPFQGPNSAKDFFVDNIIVETTHKRF